MAANLLSVDVMVQISIDVAGCGSFLQMMSKSCCSRSILVLNQSTLLLRGLYTSLILVLMYVISYSSFSSSKLSGSTGIWDVCGLTSIDVALLASIDQPAPIDRRAPITYRVQMPKIDVARLNALRPKLKPSENPPEAVRTPSDDRVDPMEVDRVPTGRTLRKRKEKVEKHLKRGANEKKKESFRKRVFRIPLDKPFDEAYFTHRFDPGQFAIPCTVKGIEFSHALCDIGAAVSILPRIIVDHLGLQVEPSKELFTFVDCPQRNSGGIVRDLEVQIGNALVPVDFQVLDIKLNWNSSLLLGRAFLSTVGAVHNLQTNRLCLTLIDPHFHYNPIRVKKPHTTSRRINDPGIIAACHCGADYETKYSASIETHTATSIHGAHQKSTDGAAEESVDSIPEDWENDYYNPTMATHIMHTEEYDEDYEEERAIEQRVTLDEEDRLLHHSSWKKKSPSIDRNRSTSIDTQPHQPSHLRASTNIAYYPSIDTNVMLPEMEITQLEVGQMITITRATQ
ncbi:hypothetical protein F2Q69_00052471 [Brassica cretica]|uniref:Aspartic peptidase DDI1-type domain-containing protein n=1 Tax=Brassica cretica TaxID=69181 RepID=A0A8S9N4V7_BRACR|nr:hypothetical protein F2Q69_00052471 [Brassica cretica]